MAAPTESYSNLNFLTPKLAYRCVNSVPSVQFMGKMCNWEHGDGDQAYHCLATRAFSCDHSVLSLKLEVEYVAQKRQSVSIAAGEWKLVLGWVLQ